MRFDDIKAVFLNCTLKRSPENSHTQQLMQVAMTIMQEQSVECEMLRATDYEIPPGVYPDQRGLAGNHFTNSRDSGRQDPAN